MKRFLLAALLGVTVLGSAGSILSGDADPQPEGLTEGVVVPMPVPPDSSWP